MPNYIDGGLAEYGLPPYKLTNFGSATFILDADDETLQGLCDDFLNAPLNRTTANRFVPGGDNRVIMVCSTFPDVRANPTLGFGYSIYTETAMMFSVFDQKHSKWSWYVPVLYLDGPGLVPEEWQAELPIAVGREMFGLAKTRAEIEIDSLLHTGSVKLIDPATANKPIKLAQAISISLLACQIPSVDEELAAAETAVLELVIELRRLKKAGKLKAAAETRLRRKISKLRSKAAHVRVRRDRSNRDRQKAINELIQMHQRPEPPKMLTPKELIEMLWGGNPYGNVGREAPPEALLLENLGFLSVNTPEPTPQPQYEFDFRLLGLRQFRDPVTLNSATVQQVIRTQFKFDRLPWSPIKTFCVTIDDPLAAKLGVGKHQTLAANRVYVYKNTDAEFGLAEIVS